MLKDFEIKKLYHSSLFLYCIKQIDSMLPCVCSVIDHRERQIDCGKNIGDNFMFKPISIEFVQYKLHHLKTYKAIGLNNISVCLLKDASEVLLTYLTNLFNRSLSSSTFPSPWICI